MRNSRKGIGMEVVSGIMFGTMGMWGRFMDGIGISFIGMTMLANLSFVVLNGLYMVSFSRRLFRITRKELLLCVLQGVFVNNLLRMSFFSASIVLPVGICSTILFCMVFPLMFVSNRLFGEPISRQKLICAFASLIGVCLVLNVFSEGGHYSFKGILLMLTAMLMVVAQVSINNALIKRGMDAITVSFYYSLSALLAMLFFVTPGSVITGVELSMKAVSIIGGFSVVNVLSLVLLTNGLKYITATQLGICQALDPITATVIGIVLFSDAFQLIQVLGMIMIVCSVVYVSRLEVPDRECEIKQAA